MRDLLSDPVLGPIMLIMAWGMAGPFIARNLFGYVPKRLRTGRHVVSEADYVRHSTRAVPGHRALADVQLDRFARLSDTAPIKVVTAPTAIIPAVPTQQAPTLSANARFVRDMVR
jgi:hypothetical protein